MTYDPSRHHRRSIRLAGYDYSRAGAYFVTNCTQTRACVFGEVVEGEMRLSDAGRMVEKWWLELNRKFPHVETDEYVTMPNHFHGIIVIIVGADLRVRPGQVEKGEHMSNTGEHTIEKGEHIGSPLPGMAGRDSTIATVIQWFKTMTTNEYIRGVKELGWPPFAGRLWQRNYYEHIIRNAESLNRIRQYILDNPMRWTMDRDNPFAAAPEPEGAWLT